MKRATAIIETKTLSPSSPIALKQSWSPNRPESWKLWAVFPASLSHSEVLQLCNAHFPILNLAGYEQKTGRMWAKPAAFTRTATRVLVTQDCYL